MLGHHQHCYIGMVEGILILHRPGRRPSIILSLQGGICEALITTVAGRS